MGNFFKTNEHPVDRVVRLAGGLTLIGAAATGLIGVWGYVGIILVATGALGSCPIYSLLGMSTCRMPKARA